MISAMRRRAAWIGILAGAASGCGVTDPVVVMQNTSPDSSAVDSDAREPGNRNAIDSSVDAAGNRTTGGNVPTGMGGSGSLEAAVQYGDDGPRGTGGYYGGGAGHDGDSEGATGDIDAAGSAGDADSGGFSGSVGEGGSTGRAGGIGAGGDGITGGAGGASIGQGGGAEIGGSAGAGGLAGAGGSAGTGGLAAAGGSAGTGGSQGDSGPPSQCLVQLLANPSFDDGNSGWKATTTSADPVISTWADPNTPSYYAYLGGYNDANETLTQTVTLPSSLQFAILSFAYRITTAEPSRLNPGAVGPDRLWAEIADTSTTPAAVQSLASFSNLDATSTWKTHSSSIDEQWSGRRVAVSFRDTTNGANITHFDIDTVSLSAFTCPPILDYSKSSTGWGPNERSWQFGQTFVPGVSTLNAIRLAFSETGTVGPITVELRHAATNALVKSWAFDVQPSATGIPVALGSNPPLALVPTDSYRIVFVPNPSVTDENRTFWEFREQTPAPYASGQAQYSDDGGLTWSNLAEQQYVGTFYFQTY